jgi:ketosteroid isomerase-like protein
LFESRRHEVHELFDCGDAVVAAVSFSTRVRGSREELVQEEAHTWTFRDGRIVRFEWGRDLQAALEAVGLRG